MTFAVGERVLYTRVEKNGCPAEPWRVAAVQKKSNLSPVYYQLIDGHNRLSGVWEEDLLADEEPARLASRQRAAVCVAQAIVTREWRGERLRKLMSQQTRLTTLSRKLPPKSSAWPIVTLRSALLAAQAALTVQIEELAIVERWVDPETSARLSQNEAWLFSLERLKQRYQNQIGH
jgi:hypothetical protein